jgi:hypothetical protein
MELLCGLASTRVFSSPYLSPMQVQPTVVWPQPEQNLTDSRTKANPPHLPQIAGSISSFLTTAVDIVTVSTAQTNNKAHQRKFV